MSRNKRATSDNQGSQSVLEKEPSSTQVQNSKEISDAKIECMVAEVVKFILIKDQKKIPVRKTDIIKEVVKEHKALYQEILKRADSRFEQVFGMKLLDIDSKNHIYILINKLEPIQDEPFSICPSNSKRGLLFVILSIILMKGGLVKEAVVWNTLKKLKVDIREKHEIFRDIKKVVTEEFVRQKYLEYVRVPYTDPQEYQFRWGLRAENELSKLKMLKIVAEIHNMEPQSWPHQYKDIIEAERSQRPEGPESPED